MVFHNEIKDRLVFDKIQECYDARVSNDAKDICFEWDKLFSAGLTVDSLRPASCSDPSMRRDLCSRDIAQSASVAPTSRNGNKERTYPISEDKLYSHNKTINSPSCPNNKSKTT